MPALHKDRKDEYRRIGQLIVDARKEAGLTQQELANELGVTGATLSEWEHGSIRVGAVELMLIAKMTGKDWSYFSGLTDQEVPQMWTRQIIQVVERMLRLGERDQDLVLEVTQGVEARKAGAVKHASKDEITSQNFSPAQPFRFSPALAGAIL